MILKDNSQVSSYYDAFGLFILYSISKFSNCVLVTGSAGFSSSVNGYGASLLIVDFTLDPHDINLGAIKSLHSLEQLIHLVAIFLWVQSRIFPLSSLLWIHMHYGWANCCCFPLGYFGFDHLGRLFCSRGWHQLHIFWPSWACLQHLPTSCCTRSNILILLNWCYLLDYFI